MCTFLEIDLPSAFVGIEMHQYTFVFWQDVHISWELKQINTHFVLKTKPIEREYNVIVLKTKPIEREYNVTGTIIFKTVELTICTGFYLGLFY